MAAIEIKYTDGTIKHYTEGWAVTRLNKNKYISKRIFTSFISAFIIFGGVFLLRRQSFDLLYFLAFIGVSVAFGIIGAYVTYSSSEREYQKFLDYQSQRQAAEPNPGVYYN